MDLLHACECCAASHFGTEFGCSLSAAIWIRSLLTIDEGPLSANHGFNEELSKTTASGRGGPQAVAGCSVDVAPAASDAAGCVQSTISSLPSACSTNAVRLSTQSPSLQYSTPLIERISA